MMGERIDRMDCVVQQGGQSEATEASPNIVSAGNLSTLSAYGLCDRRLEARAREKVSVPIFRMAVANQSGGIWGVKRHPTSPSSRFGIT